MFAVAGFGRALSRVGAASRVPASTRSFMMNPAGVLSSFARGAAAKKPTGLAQAAVRSYGTTGGPKRMPLSTARGSNKRSYSGGAGSSSSSSGETIYGLPRNAVLIVGGASAVGLVLNAASGFASSDAASSDSFDATTRKRLTATYVYVAGGLASTAFAAVAMFRAGLPRFMASRPWVFLGLSVAGTLGSSMLVHSIDYGSTIPKHAAFLVFNAAIAASLCPLVAVAPSVLMNAAAATAAMVGGLSLLAASAPSESFLWMRGPLSIGLGVMFAASIGGAFFPAIPMLHNFVLYGGLALFGGFVLYDTSSTIQRAKVTPPGYYDPINNSLRIYMDIIQIFTRMVMILSNSSGNRRK